ncbi:MAG: phage tail tape measure protein, partial [Chloroflexota bacterium]
QVVDGVKHGVQRLSLTLTAAAAGGTAFAVTMANTGDEIAKTSEKIGIATDTLQEYRFAAQRAGVAQNVFDMGMQRFVRRSAEAAQGTGEAKDALTQLGIQLTDSNGKMRSGEDLLRDVADAMSQVDNEGERLRLAFKLFDSEGVGMINMLKDGSAGLDEMTERARQLGFIMNTETLTASEKFQDHLLDLRMAFRSIQYQIGAFFLPKINETAQAFLDWFVVNRQFISLRLDKAINFIEGAISGLIGVLGSVKRQLDPVVELFGGWEAVLTTLVREGAKLGLIFLDMRRAADDLTSLV